MNRTPRPSRDHSVFAEPHLAPSEPGRVPEGVDPSERAASRILDRDDTREHPDEEAARSVYDEPALRVAGGEIRGLTYAAHWKQRAAEIGVLESWFWLVLAAVVAGPLAVAGVFLGSGFTPAEGVLFGIFGAVVIVPCIEEVLKTAVISGVVERRPWLVRRPAQIVFVGAASGLVFAAVENALYLLVYIEDPSRAVIVWRWTACVALHMGASMTASWGLVRAWSKAREAGERPSLESGFPYLIAAIVAHGLFNLVATMLGLFRVF